MGLTIAGYHPSGFGWFAHELAILVPSSHSACLAAYSPPLGTGQLLLQLESMRPPNGRALHEPADLQAVRTVFPLNVSQELGHSPFQNDHLDRGDALGAQSSVYSVQHLLLLVRRYQDPSFPVWVRLCELPSLVLGYELGLLTESLFCASELGPT